MSDFDLEDILGDSNGGAFRVAEARVGPPLEYVSDKLSSSLSMQHELFNAIVRFVPEDLPQPVGAAGTLFSTKEDGLLSESHAAFRLTVVGFLALHNMLQLANGNSDFLEQLLAMTHVDFDKWLEFVRSEGSVHGVAVDR